MKLTATQRAAATVTMNPGDSLAKLTGEGSELEQAFLRRWESLGGPRLEREFVFHPDRGWRFDFAAPVSRVAIECDGGAWTQGRHLRGKGFERDCEKLNCAALMGWAVQRLTVNMMDDRHILPIIVRAKGGAI